MKQSTIGILLCVLLAVFIIGCGQTSVQPTVSYNPDPQVGGGCGVIPMEEYGEVDYVPIEGAL